VAAAAPTLARRGGLAHCQCSWLPRPGWVVVAAAASDIVEGGDDGRGHPGASGENCAAVEQEMLRGNEWREGDGAQEGEGGAGKLRMRARRPRVYLRVSDGDFANTKRWE